MTRVRTSGLCASALPLLAIILTSVAAAAQERAVTLAEAVTLAVRNHPNIIAARGDLDVAGAARKEAFGDWLPSVTGSSSASTNSSSRFDDRTQTTISGSSTSYSGSLSASMVLFDGFRRNATGSSTRANLENAEATLTNQEFQVILQTKQAFFNAVAAEELVRVAGTRIERSEGQLKISRDKLAAGSAIRSDTLRSFVDLGSAQLQLLNAQTQSETARASLARLIGVDGPVSVISDSAGFELVELDTAALRREAIGAAPSLLQAETNARAAEAQVRVSRAGYFPSVSGSYSRSVSGAAISGLNPSWTARVSMSWPIFNGFARETGMARSRASADAALARVDDSRRQINADLTQQFASVENARVRLAIAEASRAAATEDLRVQQERYRLGASTIVDVLASQVNLDQSEVDIVQARLDFFLATAQIETIVGREI